MPYIDMLDIILVVIHNYLSSVFHMRKKERLPFLRKKYTPVGTGSAAICCFSRNSQMRTLPSSEHEINCLSEQKISDKKSTMEGQC